MLRRRSILAAVRPTVRVSHLGPAALTVAVGAVPTVVALAGGASSVSMPVLVAALTAGAALGWAGQDPAAEVLAPLPIATPVRASLRVLSVVATAVALLLVLAGAVVVLGPGMPEDLGERPVETATAALAALALALALNRRGDRAAGGAGVVAGIVLPLLVAALAYRWPRVLPSFTGGPAHDRWWLLVAILAIVLVRTGHDPARS